MWHVTVHTPAVCDTPTVCNARSAPSAMESGQQSVEDDEGIVKCGPFIALFQSLIVCK